MSGHRFLSLQGQSQTWHRNISNCNFWFARGFATSRAYSMKSRATGLSVRFFRVTMPIGTCAIGRSTGKTLISGRLVGNLNKDSRENREKAPGRQQTHPHLGGDGEHGRARIVEPAGAKGFHCDRPDRELSGGGSTHGSFTRSASAILRRRDPWILRARHDDI